MAADAGAAPEPTAWLARHPDLQPELGELLAAEVGLRQLADPLRPAPGQVMIPGAPTTFATEDHAGPDDTQPASRTSADPGVTTDRDDGEVATVNGRPEDDPTALAGGTRVRYFGDYE